MSSGVYKITNIENNKCYIGISKDIDKRKQQHIKGYKDLKSHKKLYHAVQDWGFNKFKFEILEFCPIHLLGERENFYIKKFNSFLNGYNSSWGGEGTDSKTIKDKFNLDIDIKLLFKKSDFNFNLFKKYDLNYFKSLYSNNFFKIINFNVFKIKRKLKKIETKKETSLRKYKIKRLNFYLEKFNILESEFNNKFLIWFNHYELIYNDYFNLINEYNTNFLKFINFLRLSNINLNKDNFKGKSFKFNKRTFQKNNIKYSELELIEIVEWLNVSYNKFKTFISKSVINFNDLKSIKIKINKNYAKININDFGYVQKFIGLHETTDTRFATDETKKRIYIELSLIDAFKFLKKINYYLGLDFQTIYN